MQPEEQHGFRQGRRIEGHLLTANVCLSAACVGKAVHLEMREAVAAWRKGAGVSRVLARARLVMKAASSLQRPPASMPKMTRRHLELRRSSGQARSLALRASWRAAAAKRPARRRGSPARVSGQTRVVSTAN